MVQDTGPRGLDLKTPALDVYQNGMNNLKYSFKSASCLFQVTVENFLRVLTGRLPPSTPRSKRLLSDDRSNILIYLTGISLISTYVLNKLYEKHRIENGYFKNGEKIK